MSRNYELLHQGYRDFRPDPRRVSPSLVRGPGGKPQAERSGGNQFSSILAAFRRHWLLAAGFASMVVAGAMLVTLLMKPTYAPVGRLEVDPPGSEVFSLQNGSAGEVDLDRIIATEIEVLHGDALALDVVRQLRLDLRPEFVEKQASHGEIEDGVSPAERAALDYLRSHTNVVPLKESRIIEVSFSSHDARLSRDVVNAILSAYMERHYRSRFDAVTQSSEWLSRQLADIRNQADKSTQALADYEKKHAIGDVGSEQSTIADKVQTLNRQLTQAQADRIQLESFARSINEGSGDSLPQVRDNPVVQELTKKLADTQTELSQASVIYGKNHPTVRKLENSVHELEHQLQQQRNSIMDGIKTSYRAANAREQLMQRQLNEAMGGFSELGDYNVLKHDAQANTDLYNALYARIKEAGIAAASKSSNIRVLENAALLTHPTRPKPLRNLGVALTFGILGGLFLAFVRDRLDSSIRSPEEVAQSVGLPAVGLIPRLRSPSSHVVVGRSPGLVAAQAGGPAPQVDPFVLERPDSLEAEAVRAVAASVLLSGTERTPQVLLVVSAFAQEGKTTLSVNLAAALAELAPTCLVDADVRRPSVAQSLGIDPQPGICEVLSGEVPVDRALRDHEKMPALTVMPAGEINGPASAALMSTAAADLLRQLRERFTYTVIDSAPMLGYADARALAPLADAVIIVARYGSTTRNGVDRMVEILRQIHSPVSAVVINGVHINETYAYYGKPVRY